LYLHILERSEDITPVELGFGAYFFGYIAFWFAKKIAIQREKVLVSSADMFLIAFLMVCYWSVVLAVANNASPLNWFRECLTVSALLLYFPVRDAMKSERDITLVMKVYLLMAGIVAVYNIIHYRAGSLLATYVWQLIGSRQPFGSFSFVAITIIALSLYIDVRNAKRRLLLYVGLVFFGLGLALTFSRGFWIAAIIGFLVVGVLGDSRARTRMILTGTSLLVVSMVAVFVIAGDLGKFIIQALLNRLTSSGTPLEDASVAERLAELGTVISLVKENPLVGYGFGATFSHYNIIDRFTAESLFVHNGFLLLLFKVGVAGFLLFFAYYGIIMSYAVKLSKQGKNSLFGIAVGRGIFAVFVAMLVIALSSAVFIDKSALLIISLGSAIIVALVQHTSTGDYLSQFPTSDAGKAKHT